MISVNVCACVCVCVCVCVCEHGTLFYNSVYLSLGNKAMLHYKIHIVLH